MKKNILVTGASSGFGLLVANELTRMGYNVIGTSRNPEKTQSSVPFKLLTLDITNNDSIESFGKQLFSEIKQLDVLINNAGFYLSGLAEKLLLNRVGNNWKQTFGEPSDSPMRYCPTLESNASAK